MSARRHRYSEFVTAGWILGTGLAACAIALMYQISRVEMLPQRVLAKSWLTRAEIRLTQMAQQPEHYLKCSNEGKCEIDLEAFESAARRFQGVQLERVRFDKAIAVLSGYLQVESEAGRGDRVPIRIAFPKDVFAESRMRCPSDKPFLTGFSARGSAICRALPKTECAPGQYIASVDPATLRVACADAGREISCGPSEFLSGFAWQGGGRVTYTCKSRINPFIASGFIPLTQAGSALSDE